MSQSKINNAFFLIFGQGVNFLFTLFMLPFLVRQLPIETYATYSQILLITSTLYPILSLGIGNGMVAFFTTDKKHDFNVVLNGIVNVLVVSILFYFLIYLFSDTLEFHLKNEHIWEFLKLFFFSVTLQICIDFFFNYLIFIQESKTASVLIIINNVMKLGAIYIAISTNSDIYYVFLFQIFALLCSLLIYLIIIVKKLEKTSFIWDKNLNIKLLKLSFPLSITTIIGVLMIQTDGFLISSYLGKINYAYYRTGAIEIPFLATIYGSISIIFLPEFKKLLSNKNLIGIVELKRRLIFNSALLIYPFIIVFLFFSKELLLLYLGEMFIPSVQVFLFYNLTLFIRINDYSDILILNGKTNYIAISYFFIFFFNLTLSFLAINYFGFLGPVYATIISVFFVAYIQLYKTSKILKTKISYLFNLKKIILILILDFISLYIIYFTFSLFINLNLFFVLCCSFSFFLLHFLIIYKLNIIDESIKEKFKNIIIRIWA